jgi:phospholipase/lecithinase/hemolysin
MYNELVVLGDSLSDQGNVYTITGTLIPPPEYTDGTHSGRFTNGLNYIDYLAPGLGLTVAPSVLGGTNYAYGGARTDSHPLAAFGALSLLGQRNAYIVSLGGMDANQDALHVVWAGANDLRDIIIAVLADPSIDPIPSVLNAVANVTEVVSSLAAVNATTVLAPNIPNLGIVPIVTGGGDPVPEAAALADFFNTVLDQALADVLTRFPLLNIIGFDTFTLSTEIFLDPLSFGFINASDACYSEFVEPGGTVCADPDEYFSWDGFHPTTAAHETLAARMAAQAVPEPAILTLLVFSLAGLGFARRKR